MLIQDNYYSSLENNASYINVYCDGTTGCRSLNMNITLMNGSLVDNGTDLEYAYNYKINIFCRGYISCE